MVTIPAHPEEITAVWLSAVLQQNYHLPTGRVAQIERRAVHSWAKDALALTVRYSDNAPPTAPTRLFCKIYEGGSAYAGFGEIHYYTSLAPQLTTPISPRYFGGAFDREAMRSFFLIEDISETHAPRSQTRPSLHELKRCVDALCALHGRWWQAERINQPDFLRRQGGPLRLAQAIDAANYMKSYDAFAAIFPERLAATAPDLTTEQRRFCERFVERWPEIWLERVSDGRHLTLIHGDAHVYNNIWLPNDPAGNIQIVDWETYKRGIGAYDLAYMLYFDVAKRRRHEHALLDRYHANLRRAGAVGYTRQQLNDDYRLGLLLTLFPSFWWPVVESVHAALAALEDWNGYDVI